MSEGGRGRGRGFALLDNLKKAQAAKKSDECSADSEDNPAVSSSSSSLGGRGALAMLIEKKSSGREESVSSSSSRTRGLALLDTLRARKSTPGPSASSSGVSTGVVATSSPTTSSLHERKDSVISSLSHQFSKSHITESTTSSKAKNKYFREVKDTPPVVKPGKTGTPVEVTANFIRLNFKENCVYEYEVKYEPDQDYKGLRFKLLNEHSKKLFDVHTFDGTTLYLPSSLQEEVTKVISTNPFDDTKVELSIIFRRTRRLSEMIHIYNVLFKHIMRDLDLVRFDRKHFNQHHAILIPQHRLEVWPGYVTAVDEYEGGLMLTLDSTHRVLRTQSVLNFIQETLNKCRNNFKTVLVETLVGCSVMTTYNKKLYRVDSIDYDSSPMSTFERKEKGEIVKVTYVEYYKKNYGIDIMDYNQPLLISRKSKKVVGEAEPTDFIFCLIPELCQMTGLSDDQRNDYTLMKDVATYTRITPNQRHAAFKQFITNVLSNEKAKSRLAGWGLTIAPETINITARTLPPETLLFGNNVKTTVQPRADWNSEITKQPILETVDLIKWNIIYVRKDERVTKDFVETMLRIAKPMGVNINRPEFIELNSDSNIEYIAALKKINPKLIQLVVIISPNLRDDRYAAVKKICCVDMVIPSQVIIARTLKNPAKIRSITQKIALQINCKLGGTLWGINIPLKSAMIVGIDSYHDPARKNKSVCGFVASCNSMYTKWYSRIVTQEKGQEILDGLKSCLIGSLNHYYKMNGHLPNRIIMYRDGVGDGQLMLLRDYEIPQLKVCFGLVQEEYKPSLTFIVVQKRINSRIFMKLNGSLENPPPGTIVDHDITRRNWFDFLIVSQKVNQGTVTPSHYVVICDDSETDPDIWQRLTYKLCHLYYNWPGTIRVPAPCQYAHKLAYLVGCSIHQTPGEGLWDKLYFL